MRRAYAFFVLLLGISSSLAAQRSGTVPSGTPIRATVARSPAVPLRGTVVDFRNDTLWVRTELGVVTPLPRRDVAVLELSAGKRAHTVEGMGIGLIGGAGVGAGVGLVIGHGSFPGSGAYGLLGATVGAAGGLILGMVIGSAVQTEQWQRAPGWGWGWNVAVSTGPGIGLAIEF
jgi:hypothetical protein